MWWRVMIVMGCFVLGWPGWSLAEEPVVLDVRTEPTGGVRATATILFPVEPAIIQRLLTDYAHWPELFDVRMRMAEIREEDGKAFTDIRIDHALLPGERRLLSETRTLPTGGLLTELKGGDFKQYHRVWKLTPVDGGAHTKAEFELLVEIDMMVPDWMVAAAMRRDLETHFRIVREKALAQAKQQLQSERLQ
jgi:ribosome-associated toxin RatA of RatAB toxin-antitoxin module